MTISFLNEMKPYFYSFCLESDKINNQKILQNIFS